MSYPQYPNQPGNNIYPGNQMFPIANPGQNLGIAGFVLSFFFWPLGLILSLVSFSRSRKAGFKATGLALAGLILSAISFVFMIFALSTGLFATLLHW